jgi:hypothetical protein
VIWLLRLYPPMWRRRYAGEVAEMLAGRGFSLRVAVDLIAGAIDTWLHPSATLAAAAAASPPAEEKERNMLSKVLRLDCSAMYGPDISKDDQWKSGVSVIWWTFVLTSAWLGLRVVFGGSSPLDSLSMLPFLFSLVYSMRYTYLKGRPASVQVVFIGGVTVICTVILLAAGWVAAQL